LVLPDFQALIIAYPQKTNFFAKRINILIREEDVTRLTKDLNELNLNMDRLLANCNTLHQYQVESKLVVDIGNASTIVGVLKQVRDRADSLFRAFLEAWSLGCHPSHEAMLFLDTPVISSNKHSSLNPKESPSKFRLVLRGKPTNLDESSWLETNVTVSGEGDSKNDKLKDHN